MQGLQKASLIFCLVDLSIGVSGVLKSPTITVLLLISPFIFVGKDKDERAWHG